MSLLDSFLVRAALAGVGVALAAGPPGCFVVWRRMAYFGDATAHAAILGVALALTFSLPVFVGALVAALVMASTVVGLSGRSHGVDTLLGVLAHSALAVGLVAVAFIPGVRIDLMAYLFGDILAVSRDDLIVIWVGAALVLALLAWRWSPLLLVTLNADLAASAGLDTKREEAALTLALALVVAVGIKVVGVLLIAALLIVPAAAARAFSGTPERMALTAAAIGAMSALGGLALAFRFDTPAGPTIVALAAGLFAVSMAAAALRASGPR